MRSRTSRRRLLLSTTMLMGALTSYGGRAYGQMVCTNTGGSNFVCDGFSDDTQTITADNATVTTTNDFEIDTTVTSGSGGDGVVITGEGALSYEDDEASPITAQYTALRVESTGDDAATMTDGSISIVTNGDLTGGVNDPVGGIAYGIWATNLGSGAVYIKATGEITSYTADGIRADLGNGIIMGPRGTSITIITGAGAVTGDDHGITATNYTGTGAITITTGTGAVTGEGLNGIDVFNSRDSNAGITITTNSGGMSPDTGAVTGDNTGIYAVNLGDGSIVINAGGDVIGDDDEYYGIYARNGSSFTGAAGQNIEITTAAGTDVSGGTGIQAINLGYGFIEITANGNVTGGGVDPMNGPYGDDGILAYNSFYSDSGITITTGASSTVSGQDNGIIAQNFGDGGILITANGAVTGAGGTTAAGDYSAGIQAYNSNNSEYGITITTGSNAVSGGDDGIYAQNYGEGAVVINVAGAVTGTYRDGIYAYNSDTSAIGISITTGAGAVSGSESGIDARNYGSGALTITTGEEVRGVFSDGIYAVNSMTSSYGIAIITGSGTVRGGDEGIEARNLGAGELRIEVQGAVTGTNSDGIFAYNSEYSDSGIAITTGAGAVTGSVSGIQAGNSGAGALSIMTGDGGVTGAAGDGIYAFNSMDSDYGITITTGAGAVTGGDDGIYAQNYGEGAVVINVAGAVTGTFDHGIFAYNSPASGYGITITTGAGAVEGRDIGIFAINRGSGALNIQTSGDVTGRVGIGASNSEYSDFGLSIATGSGAVMGSEIGILATQEGSGALTIETNGDVTGGNAGIVANNGFFTSEYAGTDLSVVTAEGTTVAGATGIRARNFGSGALEITANGAVTGGDDGIDAFNTFKSDDGLTITTGAGAITGGDYGINARNYGGGALDITIGGDVTGGAGGINAFNDNASTVTITNLAGGSISAASNLAIDVDATAAYADISNAGLITGFIDLTDQSDLFTNESGGVFNATGGDSLFGAGDDLFTNAGAVRTAFDSAAVETVAFLGLEQFDNAGTISLQDGQEGDSFTLSGDFDGQSGSTLAVDTFLGGPGSQSDTLTIEGNVTGLTGIVVQDTNPGPGAANAVIPIVFVEGAASGDEFELANGPIDKGFFQYDLFFRPTGSGVFELRSVGIPADDVSDSDLVPAAGPGAMLLPQLLTASQDIWHQTSDTWFDRSADLRAARWHGYSTAALSPKTYAAPKPLTAGVWARGSHADLDRDDRVTTTTMGRDFRFDLDRELDVSDVQSGIDAPLRGVFNPQDVLILSVFGGGVWAGLDYDALSRRFDYDGGQVGAAATYLSGSWFVDALFNAQFLDLEAKALGFPDKDLDAETYGFRVDTGYRIGGKYFLEPLLTLAYADSDLEGFTFAGNTVSFEAEDSLRGRVGLRAGVTWLMGSLRLEPFVIGSYWGELDDDDNRAKLVSNGFRFDLEDHSEDEWGEVSLGANLFTAGNHAISAFSKVDIIFGDDTEGYAASGGLRWQW